MMRRFVILASCLALATCTPAQNVSLPGPAAPSAKTIYVVQGEVPGSLASVPVASSGSTTPATFIKGGFLDFSFFDAVDAHGNVWATSCLGVSQSGPFAFAPGTTDGHTPTFSIAGSATNLSGCQEGIAFDTSGNVYVGDSAGSPNVLGPQVAVFAAGINGNVAPIRAITGANTNLSSPTGVTVASDGTLYVADSKQSVLGVPKAVYVFAPGATGNIAPERTIVGVDTGLKFPEGVLLDAAGDLYVADAGDDSIRVFPPNANGDVAPIRTINGAATGLHGPCGIAMDSAGFLYVGSLAIDVNRPVVIFAPGASGNVAPYATITINEPNYLTPAGVAVQ